MRAKKILFVPQNKEHILNMNPVIELLTAEGFVCEYLKTNNFFFQDLKYPNDIKTISFSDTKLSKSFYNVSSLERIRTIYGLKDQTKATVTKYDSFVFGNDGAIQRQFIYFARKQNKPCSMILDGLISAPVTFDFWDVFIKSDNKVADLREYLEKKAIIFSSKMFAKTAISPYFPSVIACGNLNHIYGIGEFSTNEIKRYALKKTKIFNTGLPRMIPYFQETRASFIPNYPKSVCFITSAYKWHGLFSYHQYQIKDILLIRKCLDELYPNESHILYIKLHPRENPEDYAQFRESKGIILVEKEPFIDSVFNYRILLSNLSTCIVEGNNLGINVGSLMINFPYWKVKKGFLSSNSINKYFSEESLKTYIKNQFENSEVFFNDSSFSEFLSNETPSSIDRISENIKSLF